MARIDSESIAMMNKEIQTREKSKIVIPDNATNGDVIKALFPKTPYGVSLDVYQKEMVFTTSKDWWNAPYDKETL